MFFKETSAHVYTPSSYVFRLTWGQFLSPAVCPAQVSYAFIKALPDREEWNLFQRGNVKVKGKGEMKTFFLLGRAGSSMQLPPPDAGAYESEVQTPAYSAGSSSGYHSPFPYRE